MAAVHRKPPMQVGQVWEGRSKVGYPFTRRRITEITEKTVSWELAGSCFKGAQSGTTSRVGWLAWAKAQVHR